MPKRTLVNLFLAGVRDRAQSLLLGPYEVPVVGDPGERAVLTAPGVKAAYLDLVPDDSAWRNATPARGLPAVLGHRPVTDLDDVLAPAFLLAGTRDEVVPMGPIERAADELTDVTFVTLPADHFDVFGRAFEAAVGHQLAFLDTHVR